MWKTSIKIPELNKKTATAFMEMILRVSRLAKVPTRAAWKVVPNGNYYDVTADYKEYPYVPLKQRPKIRVLNKAKQQ